MRASSRSTCSAAGIYINPVCEFWNNAMKCRFCPTGQNVGGVENAAKTIQDVVDTCRAATIGRDMADCAPPDYSDMRTVMAAVYDACRRYRIPIGLAPNIQVSLVVNPDDAAMLAPRDASFYRYQLWRRSLRTAARPLFRRRLRPARAAN
jgi:hypothetical protein